jgi:hypothetical protein
MQLTNLDTIVKGLLIARGYSIHYYMQFLYLGSRGYEELHFDTLKNIKTVSLPINSYNAISLPCDMMDWVKIGIPNGQFVIPLTERAGISNLNNFDTTGNKIDFDNQVLNNFTDTFFNGYLGYYNSFDGSNTGRLFGLGTVNDSYTFKFMPQRNEIQLHQNIQASNIILQYMSNGSSIDNATAISPYAKSAIEMYIIWKMKEGSRAYGLGERSEARMQWEHQHLLLRARKNDLTKDKIVAMIRRRSYGTPKG